MKGEDDIKTTQQQPAEPLQEEPKKPTPLQEAIREQVTEDEAPLSASVTLRKILGGDFLTAEILRRQIGVIILIAFMTMIYVSNRYSCQQDMLELDKLKEELKDAKYKALAVSSDLTEMCRESNVLKMLRNGADSVLQIPSQPPYIINIPENE